MTIFCKYIKIVLSFRIVDDSLTTTTELIDSGVVLFTSSEDRGIKEENVCTYYTCSNSTSLRENR